MSDLHAVPSVSTKPPSTENVFLVSDNWIGTGEVFKGASETSSSDRIYKVDLVYCVIDYLNDTMMQYI